MEYCDKLEQYAEPPRVFHEDFSRVWSEYSVICHNSSFFGHHSIFTPRGDIEYQYSPLGVILNIKNIRSNILHSTLVLWRQITWNNGHSCSLRASPSQYVGPRRYRPPACDVSQLPEDLDAVVISHSHYDHLVRQFSSFFSYFSYLNFDL